MLLSLVFITSALAAYVPSDPWSTLTPDASIKGAATTYDGTFGIAVVPITLGSSTLLAKRAVTQVADGQVQATTGSDLLSTKSTAQPVSQITDGQIQASTATKTTVQPISQIGDGQIQATTATKKTAQPVSQISDGQIQATTATKSTAHAISQIGDGQIQATATKSTAQPVSQITDGQIQASTTTKATASGASQISDGQVQATTATTSVASQISDGQPQALGTSVPSTDSADVVACKVDGTLQLTLSGGILKDEKGRIGSIVANRQFQFDGPPPQAGAIYAAGWSISDNKLAIGNSTVFYQCLSGTFYNLYDESLGSHCNPVHLEVTGLVDC